MPVLFQGLLIASFFFFLWITLLIFVYNYFFFIEDLRCTIPGQRLQICILLTGLDLDFLKLNTAANDFSLLPKFSSQSNVLSLEWCTGQCWISDEGSQSWQISDICKKPQKHKEILMSLLYIQQPIRIYSEHSVLISFK